MTSRFFPVGVLFAVSLMAAQAQFDRRSAEIALRTPAEVRFETLSRIRRQQSARERVERNRQLRLDTLKRKLLASAMGPSLIRELNEHTWDHLRFGMSEPAVFLSLDKPDRKLFESNVDGVHRVGYYFTGPNNAGATIVFHDGKCFRGSSMAYVPLPLKSRVVHGDGGNNRRLAIFLSVTQTTQRASRRRQVATDVEAT